MDFPPTLIILEPNSTPIVCDESALTIIQENVGEMLVIKKQKRELNNN